MREERKSPFSRFYQINKDNSDYLRSCLDENPKALKLLLFIFDHMDKYNAVICSYKVFQETLGMGQATVARCVKYLKDHGFLYVYKTGTSNVYVANNDHSPEKCIHAVASLGNNCCLFLWRAVENTF